MRRVAPHTHVFFALDDGHEFRYIDIRRFGKMRMLSGGSQQTALDKLGLDALEASDSQSFPRSCVRGARESRRCCLIKVCCAAWGTSIPTKACGERASIRRGLARI